VVLAFFLLAIPALLLRLLPQLHRIRVNAALEHDDTKIKRTCQTHGALFLCYRPGVMTWFHAFFTARRALMSFIFVFVPVFHKQLLTAFVLLSLAFVHITTLPFLSAFDNVVGGVFAFALVALAVIEMLFVSFDPHTDQTFYIQDALNSPMGRSLRSCQGLTILGLSVFVIAYKLRVYGKRWRTYWDKGARLCRRSWAFLLLPVLGLAARHDEGRGVPLGAITMETFNAKDTEEDDTVHGVNPAHAPAALGGEGGGQEQQQAMLRPVN
jgi:hypothetical protein